MLIRFNVKNFLSFSSSEDDRSEEFSMICGKVRSKKDHVFDDGNLKLLKFAAIYGANASGKSNLVKSMKFMRSTVQRGLPKGHSDLFCKSDSSNKFKPSYFEIEIKLDQKYYSYGFEVLLSNSEFISEWLIELHPDNSDRTLFLRDIANSTFEIGGQLSEKGLYEKIKSYMEDIQDDTSALFLTIMSKNKKNLYESFPSANVLKDVFTWVDKQFDINFPNQPISDYTYLVKADKVSEICKLISAFGTGITNFELVEIDSEKVIRKYPDAFWKEILATIDKRLAEVKNNPKREELGLIVRSPGDFLIITIDKEENIKFETIEFYHSAKDILFRLDEESDGTVRILDLLEILISGNGKTYVIDELDRCLHPSLTYKFVETYFEFAKERNIQLIVTTHESRLLDFDLLRRDEVWFVDKKQTGVSNIYSLEEYNARFDQKIDKAYLEGRYGGVPIFSTVFPVKED